MTTHALATVRKVSPLWLLVLLGSGLPSLLAELTDADRFAVGTAQIVLLAVVAVVVHLHPRGRAFRNPAVALTVLALFLHLGLNLLRAPGRQVWIFSAEDPAAHTLAWQALSSFLSLGILAFLLARGLTRKRLFLTRGDLQADAAPIRWLGHSSPKPWSRFGRDIAIILTSATVLFLLLSGGFAGLSAGNLLAALPLIVGFSAINAANEKFQFRSVLVGILEPLGNAQAIAVASGFVFGTWHFAGVPGGIVGAAMAGFAGWLWARSMLETRGMLMAWTLHLLQDLVIFAALLA